MVEDWAERRSFAARIMDLMGGSEEAYGTYDPTQARPVPGTKIEIKTSARTLRGAVNEARWAAHIEGREPLGIIPLREDDMVIWGCIDVDKYDLDLPALCGRVTELGLPLTVGRSKSGGAHIFVFLTKPGDPTRVQQYLRACATRLGVGGSEIFPKQTSLVRERGDVGNWIIAPYFGEAMPCLRSSGAELTLEEFLRGAERARVSPTELEDPEPRPLKRGRAAGPLADGPPCLEHLVEEGFPDGTRNNGLFALGVYARKKWPDDWDPHIDEMNHLYMKPPLGAEEVMGVVKSLRRRDYQYKCTEVPLCTHCNASLCRRRVHGISDRSGDPMITGLSVLETEPVVWFVDIDGQHRLDLATEDLIEYRRFQVACAERLYKMYPPLPRGRWQEQVAEAMLTVVRVEASPDVSRHGSLREAVSEYLTNRWRAKRQEDLLANRPWEDEHAKRVYFRMSHLMKHLHTEGLVGYSQSRVVAWVRDQGGDKHFFNIKNTGVNAWWLPAGMFHSPATPDPPRIDEEVM